MQEHIHIKIHKTTLEQLKEVGCLDRVDSAKNTFIDRPVK